MFREGLILSNNHIIAISNNITDIVISVRYVVGLSEFYYQKYLQVNISIQSKVMAQKVVLYTHGSQSDILNWISMKT